METPRRNRLDLNTPVEKAIYEAGQLIEKMGADVKLTSAQIKLQEARELVADFIDETEPLFKYGDKVLSLMNNEYIFLCLVPFDKTKCYLTDTRNKGVGSVCIQPLSNLKLITEEQLKPSI
jgi:hypothetical protein